MSVHRYELPPVKAGGRPRPRWRVNFEKAPDPETGKRRTSTKRGFTTLRAAREWDAAQHTQAASGSYPILVGSELLSTYLLEWLDGLALKATTVAGYRVVVEKRLIPLLGGYQLARLEPEHIDIAYRTLEREGGRHGQPLSAKTVLNAHRVLHRALRDAVERGRLRRNPAALAHPPSTRVAVTWAAARQIWTPEQLRVWLAGIRGDRLYGAWLLLATTGLRRGELAGLAWDAVDLEGGVVEVRRQLVLVDNRPVFEPSTKTPKGWRTIALDPETVAVLRTHRARSSQEKLALGPAYQDHGLVVCWEDGSPVNPERLRQWLQAAAKRLGLPRVTVHGLRHSYATAALRAGVSPEVLAGRLGHEDVATTLRVYAHVRREDDEAAARTAARWITG